MSKHRRAFLSVQFVGSDDGTYGEPEAIRNIQQHFDVKIINLPFVLP